MTLTSLTLTSRDKADLLVYMSRMSRPAALYSVWFFSYPQQPAEVGVRSI